MKTLIVLFLSILPTLSIAQCSLDIPDGVLTSAPLSSLVSEFNPSSFARNDVTYLCYSRADNTTFDAIRISLLFTHGSTQYSIRLSYMCRGSSWRYDSSWAATLLSAADYIATNMTIEGCTSCADSSTESFGSPTGCTVASPCDSSPCSNGGTCDRTGLTTSSCSCAAPWGGPACSTCTRTCQNGGTLNGASCTCGCSGSFTGDQCQNSADPTPSSTGLSPGAIVGIVIACLVALALIIGIVVLIIVVLAMYNSRKSQRV